MSSRICCCIYRARVDKSQWTSSSWGGGLKTGKDGTRTIAERPYFNPQLGVRETLEIIWVFGNFKVCPQWHTSSNKTLSPNPCLTVQSAGSGIPTHESMWVTLIQSSTVSVVILLQPLWVHMGNGPTMTGQYQFIVDIYYFYLLKSFLYIFFTNDSRDLRGKGMR